MRAILSISILSLISAPSFAADIIFDPDPVPPIVSLPEGPFTWSGRYVGVDLGFGRGKVKESFVTENIPESIFNIRQTEGAFGGVYARFGRQARKLYFGFEGDIQYAGIKGTHADDGGPVAEFTTQWLGSTRLRAGYAMNDMFGQDMGHLLPYVTGGLAFGSFKATVTDNGNEWVGERGDTGYTLGGGFDYAINRNTIAKLEYQYLDFGNRSFSDETDYARVRVKGHTLRAGVAYKF